MAIFPIIDGQRPQGKMSEPDQTTAAVESQPQDQPPNREDDLIDFGQSEAPAPAPAPAPEEVTVPVPSAEQPAASTQVTEQVPMSVPSTEPPKSEIESMLASTGKPAQGGPLLDFTPTAKSDPTAINK